MRLSVRVRASLVYRYLVRVYFEPVPDARHC
jgi:hypothetical protein